MATATRYEGLAIACVLAVAAAAQSPRGRRLGTAAAVFLPSATVMVVWITFSQILRHDAFHWLVEAREIGTPPRDAGWLPADRNLATSFAYIAERSVLFAPALLLLVPMAAWVEAATIARSGRAGAGPLGVVAAGGVFPAYVGLALLSNSTFGNPRYFVSLSIVAVVGVIWALGHPRSPAYKRPLLKAALTASLVVAILTGTVAELDPKITAVEGERFALRMLLGLDPPIEAPGSTRSNLDVIGWRQAMAWIDDHVDAGQLVVADSSVAFPALAFTAHPDRLLVQEDRGFEQELARVDPHFEWVLMAVSGSGRPGSLDSTLQAVLESPPPGLAWRLEKTFAIGNLYRLGPPDPPETPQ